MVPSKGENMGKSVKPLFVSLFLVAAALSPLLADSAQDTLEQFLGAMAAMDFSQEYSFLSSEDHRAMSEQEYIETVHQFDLGIERSKELSLTLYDFLTKEKLEYKIRSASGEGNKQIFDVELDFVNHLEVLFGIGFDLPELGDPSIPKAETEAMVTQWLEKNYPDGSPPREKAPSPFTLVNEEGQWRVYMNLQKEAARKKAAELREKADKVAHRRDYEQAIELLEQAKEIDPETNVQFRIDRFKGDLEKQRKVDRFVEQYLKITDSELFFGEQQGIKIVLKDDNPRNLFNVKISIDFLSAGQAVVQTLTMEFDLFSVGFDKVEQYDLEYIFPLNPEGWDGESYELKIVDVFPVD